MELMIVEQKKITDTKQIMRCLAGVSYSLTIFEKYLSFELIILHFECMGFYAYMLAFLRPVTFLASACYSLSYFSL